MDDGKTIEDIFPSSILHRLLSKILSIVHRPSSIILFLFFFFSCQVPEEGCTDLAASNFDITALKTCTNCCTYPVMRLKTEYYWGSESVFFNFGTTYFIGKDSTKQDSIQFVSAQFFISEIILTSATSGKLATVNDSIALYRDKDTIMKPNYYALVGKNNGFDYTLGHFINFNTYKNISFKIGIDQDVNKTIPSKMPSSSPFSNKSDINYDSTSNPRSYIFHKFIFAKGVGFKDTVRLNIETAQTFTSGCNLTFLSGFDAIILLKIDYKQLFNTVNVTDSTSIMITKIVNNYQYAFKVQ